MTARKKPVVTGVDTDQARHEELKVKALTSLKDFCNLIKFRGGSKCFGKVHLELMEWLSLSKEEQGTRKLLLMPRGHLKSTICSQLYPLWRIYINPNIRIFIDSNSLPLARRNLRVIDVYLRDKELQETVWNKRPHIQGQLVPDLELGGVRASRQSQVDQSVVKKVLWNAYAKQVNRPNKSLGEPTITCGSLMSAVTGWHFDLYIPDDLVDRKNSRTEPLRTRIEEHLAEIESVLDPWNPKEKFGNEILMLGTRYYREDAYAQRIPDTETWDVFTKNIYKNGVDYKDGTLWPERFSVEYLERKRKALFRLGKSKEWFSQYLNQIVDDEGAIFKSSMFRYFDERALFKSQRGWEIKRTGGKPNIWLRPVMAVDWAFTANSRSDFNSVVVIAQDDQGRIFVLDSYIAKCTPDMLYPEMLRMAAYWGVITIGMESTRAWETIQGFKRYMTDKRFNTGRIWPCVSIDTKAQKNVKIETTLCPYYAGGRIIHSKKLHQGQLEQQLLHYPEDKDDGPDSLAMAIQLALKPAAHKTRPMGNTQTLMSLIGGNR